MQTIKKTYQTSQEIRKSNFIAFLTPFSEFETLYKRLKEEHPKAAHIVWAYRHLNKFHQIVENQSDDGEPKGTSGPAALSALKGANLIECAVLIVRYFGGIKLGTGGLVRAYGSSTNLAIDGAEVVKFELRYDCSFFTSYQLLSRVEYFLEQNNIDSLKEFDENGAKIEINLTKDELKKLLDLTNEFYNKDDFYYLSLPTVAKEFLF
ncbi:YigZ family protein [uncultured Campylobacter sp.]|uniref:IMPACT family protein n=1 Tax=uncultured Campylobacter sp. TaxID=218934 RepID=UPI00261A8E05|nr:YigZ family protein [uncultured Campylobacter sp.]